MSDFEDMMIDDGFSDEMDYMDHLEDDWLDKSCNDAWDSDYEEQMNEEGYVNIGGRYFREDYIEELNESGYVIVNGEVVKKSDNEDSVSYASDSINDKVDETGLLF